MTVLRPTRTPRGRPLGSKGPQKRPRPPMRVLIGQDRLRMAHLAGAGYSAHEIGDAVGTTAHRVRYTTRRLGIPLDPKLPSERILKVKLPKSVLALLEAHADEHSLDIIVLCGALLCQAARETDLVLLSIDTLNGVA